MDAGRQKARVLGTESTSFRSTMWRESLPPTHRHLCYPQDSMHNAPFKVSRCQGHRVCWRPADNFRDNFRTISERTRPASARPMSDRTPSARPGSARPLSTARASPKFFSPRGHIAIDSSLSHAVSTGRAPSRPLCHELSLTHELYRAPSRQHLCSRTISDDNLYCRRDSVRLNRAHEHIIASRQSAHTKLSRDFLSKWRTGPQLASDVQKRMGSQPATTHAIKRGARQVYHFSEDELDGAKKVVLELREMWRGQVLYTLNHYTAKLNHYTCGRYGVDRYFVPWPSYPQKSN